MTLVVPDEEFLRQALAEGIECRIQGFDGDFGFLSNFWPSPIEVDRILYPTVEHAYQAAKTTNRAEREQMAALPTPGAAKRAGKKLAPRADWDAVKLTVMEALVLQKFQVHADLRAKLLATSNCYLEETNSWGDRFWGVSGGQGANHLGRILMQVREHLRQETGGSPSATTGRVPG